MRAVLLFLVLIIVVLVAYILVPVEQMQSQARNTIEQAQSLHNSLDFDTVVDGFGSLLEGQEYVLPGEEVVVEQGDVVVTPDTQVLDVSPQGADETSPDEAGSAVLMR